jgi:hypothetical protein
MTDPDLQPSPHPYGVRRTRSALIALVLAIGVIAILLFLEWRTSRRFVPADARPADTNCVAARFGMSCRG